MYSNSYSHNVIFLTTFSIIVIYLDILQLQTNLHCSYSLNSYLTGAAIVLNYYPPSIILVSKDKTNIQS